MKIPFLDLPAQYQTIKDEVKKEIDKVCESQMLCLGPAVEKFEKKIAEYIGSDHAIGVSSGSDALLVSLMALDLEEGDEVITTPFTFFATAGAIARVGAKPVFVDIDPDSFNIDPEKIEEKINENTKAVIPVHLYGQVTQMKPIKQLAEKYDLYIIEDACQSIGASQNGIKAGNLGDTGCFSFYPTKNLGAFGDGGLVTTNDENLYRKIKTLRDHGQNPRYFYSMIGGNFRLDGIQGAVLAVKLDYIDQWNQKREQNAQTYNSFFENSPVKTPKIEQNNNHVYHQYTIKAPDRNELQKYLAKNNIASAIFYPRPLHLQECFNDLGYREGDFPETEKICQEVLSLPIYPELSNEQVEFVAQKVLDFYK